MLMAKCNQAGGRGKRIRDTGRIRCNRLIHAVLIDHESPANGIISFEQQDLSCCIKCKQLQTVSMTRQAFPAQNNISRFIECYGMYTSQLQFSAGLQCLITSRDPVWIHRLRLSPFQTQQQRRWCTVAFSSRSQRTIENDLHPRYTG